MSERKVLHKQMYRRGFAGGTVNTTVCGRVRQGKEMNVAVGDEKVTCKFCLKELRRR